MPKQPTRVRAAAATVTVTVQDPADQLHCRKLIQVLQDAGDQARLRANFRQNVLELHVQPHRDGWVRRLFSRDEIAMERLAVRRALINAASNVTPERLRKLGSPGRRAVRALRDAAGLDLDRDVKARQVRSATALLAGGKKRRAFIDSPVKSRSAWLAQTGANTLASGDGARRVQLRKFCIDSSAAARLPAMLSDSKEKPVSIAASVSIFRAAALGFIVEDMKGGKHTPQALAAQIRRRSDSRLLRLFIVLWLRAVAAGKITKNDYPWFDAVNWLVIALNGARPTSPGATRAPKSARVVSPVAAPLARAQSTAPAPTPTPPRRQLRSRASAPAKPVETSKLPPVAHAAPRPGLPQQGRQGVSLRMLNQLQSPTRLADTPAPQVTVARSASHDAAPPGPVFRPAAEQASTTPISQADRLAPTATLLDMLLEYLASENTATSGSSGADSQLLGSPGADALPENGQ